MAERFHENFFTFAAEDNYELGCMMGAEFSDPARRIFLSRSREATWETEKSKAAKYLAPTRAHFPYHVRELEGYAKGANMDFSDLWTLSLEDEAQEESSDRCTTVITNGGKLICHNEDWDKGSENSLCIVRKEIVDLSILELYYFNTLGGNSISINSNGFITAVNSLSAADARTGIPRNVIARIISETRDPDADIEKFKNIPRASGDNYNIIHREGKIWNIESTAERLQANNPASPFAHTNHYLTELKAYEVDDGSQGTFERLAFARAKIHPRMSIKEVEEFSADESKGPKMSIMNERTIAKMIIDLESSVARIWLGREADKKWIDYDLRMLQGHSG